MAKREVIRWDVGDDRVARDDGFPTFGITAVYGPDPIREVHVNAIEVYTSAVDRDLILAVLNDLTEQRAAGI
jgi:hypothetical protein